MASRPENAACSTLKKRNRKNQQPETNSKYAKRDDLLTNQLQSFEYYIDLETPINELSCCLWLK